jgi:hypothetical protein
MRVPSGTPESMPNGESPAGQRGSRVPAHCDVAHARVTGHPWIGLGNQRSDMARPLQKGRALPPGMQPGSETENNVIRGPKAGL